MDKLELELVDTFDTVSWLDTLPGMLSLSVDRTTSIPADNRHIARQQDFRLLLLVHYILQIFEFYEQDLRPCKYFRCKQHSASKIS